MSSIVTPKPDTQETLLPQFEHSVPLDARIHIAGHRGLVGSAIWRFMQHLGYSGLRGLPSCDLDLRERQSVFEYYAATKPEYVILAAAKVGGILANSTYPADFLSDNLRIQTNVLDAAQESGVKRLLFLGSSCIYPKFASQPIRETSLLRGILEPSNKAYAIAKIAGICHVQALRQQYGVSFISAMPTNLYGPFDNFDAENSHVVPGMMRKFHEAKQTESPSVVLWGTGQPRRELMHVDDLARACLTLLKSYDQDEPINVGTGKDLTICDLASAIAETVGYKGKVLWDATKPDGTPRKLLDVTRIRSLGWESQTPLSEGLRTTYSWYQASVAQ